MTVLHMHFSSLQLIAASLLLFAVDETLAIAFRNGKHAKTVKELGFWLTFGWMLLFWQATHSIWLSALYFLGMFFVVALTIRVVVEVRHELGELIADIADHYYRRLRRA